MLALAGMLVAAASAQAGSGPPVETGAPTLIGQDKEGNQLTAKNGTWTGAMPFSYEYVWEHYEHSEWTVMSSIPVTETRYTLLASDVGTKIRVKVKVKNSAGENEATTNATEPIAAAPPKNSELPAITPSTPSEGQLLTATAGKWEGTPASKYIYEWELCGSKCTVLATHEATAGSDTYRLRSGAGSVVRVTVTDVNPAGSKSATSPSTGTVTGVAPINETPPTITGEAREGQLFTAHAGSWYGVQPIEYSYEWLGCGALTECMPVGASGSTYTPTSAQSGETIEVRVTAKNSLGSTQATSAPTSPIESSPHNTAPPAISGEAREGSTLSASEGTWKGSQPITYSYTWESCAHEQPCRSIEGAGSGASYTLGTHDVGLKIQAKVTATNSVGSETATSAQTGIVQSEAPHNAAPPTVSGEALEGDTLTASEGTWTGSGLEYAYEWERCQGSSCAEVGASRTYTLTHTDVGSTLQVRVTASNAAGSASATSHASETVQGGVTAIGWGENFHGQLGQVFRDGAEISPVPVLGVSGISQLAAGDSDAYALLDSGRLVAWGGNDNGQDGDDNRFAAWEQGKSHVTVEELHNENPNEPAELTGVEQVATADEHALAVMENGTVKTWGANGLGTLGVGIQGPEYETNFNGSVARTVRWPANSAEKHELKGITAVAAGGASDYALTGSEEVYAWGSDTVGQLGVKFESKNEHNAEGEECHTETTHANTYEACSEFPRKVMWVNPDTKVEEPLSHIKAIAAGAWAGYAIREVEGVRYLVSWGADMDGELGNQPETEKEKNKPPDYVDRLNPSTHESERLTGVVEVDPGYDNAVARLSNGEVLGWGDAENWSLTMKPAEATTFKVGGANAANDCKKPKTEEQEAKRIAGIERKIAKFKEELKTAEANLKAAEEKLKAAEENHESAEVTKQAEAVKHENEQIHKLNKKIPASEEKLNEPAPYLYCLKKATPLPALETLGSVEGVSEGNHYGLAVIGGKVFAWGSNGHGQQGNGRQPGEGENPETGEPTPESETGYPIHEVHGFGTAVGVYAAGTHSVVLLAASDPRLPAPVTAEGARGELEHVQSPAIRMEWQPKTVNAVETVTPSQIVYKLSQRSGEEPVAEEGGGEGEGPPENISLPTIELGGEPIEEAPVVGEKLRATTGTWNGERPKFTYHWLRCQGSGSEETCLHIVRWEARGTENGETKKEHLEITKEEKEALEAAKPGWTWYEGQANLAGHTVSAGDVHHRLKAEIDASNSQVEEPIVALSKPTKQVYATEQEREEAEEVAGGEEEGTLLTTTLKCGSEARPQCTSPSLISFALEKYREEGKGKPLYREIPLLAQPYEVKVLSPGVGGNERTRVMVILPDGPPAITSNPTNVSLKAGEDAYFRASAEGGPKPSVQWEVSSDGGATWSVVAGATTTTLTLAKVEAAQSGQQYRALFTNGEGQKATAAATLTVSP